MGLQVELVSPERVVYSGEAEMVIARTVEGGDIAFLDGHAPFVGALEIATATLSLANDREEQVAVHGGFVEVSSETVGGPSEGAASAGSGPGEGPAPARRTIVTILSDVAELSSEIDISRAEQAKERAQAALHQEHDVETEAALRRAHVRLAAVNA